MTPRPHSSNSHRQAGFTLVELMVAVALGLLVAGAAVAALIISRQGFTSVDSSSQLRENARFAASLIQRVSVQAGFEDAAGGMLTSPKDSGLRGFDNAVVATASPATATAPTITSGSRPGSCGSVSDTSCVNGSDVLQISYWGMSRMISGVMSADGSMINCAGMSEPGSPAVTQRAVSIFHVARSSSGEPTLACSYRNPTSGNWETVPLVTGVEGFQVLYGVDNVTPLAAPTGGTDSVAERYLRASQLDAGTPVATEANWRRVRTLRIGLLIRGAPGSAQDRAATGATWPVLGAGFSDSADVKSDLTTAADGRLRQSVVFTVHLRNPQSAP